MRTCIQGTIAVAAVAILAGTGPADAQSERELVPLYGLDLGDELSFPDWPSKQSEWEDHLDAPELGGGDYAELFARAEDVPWASTVACCDDVGVPCWTARAAAVMMERTNPSYRLLFQDPLDPDLNFDRSNFDFDFELGVDASLARRLNPRHDLQVRYLRVDGWNARATGSTDPAAGIVVQSDPPLFFMPGRDITATYQSELESLELNLRRRFSSHLTLLMGFRYADVDERFHADLSGPGPVLGTYDTVTDNRLFGLQLGGEAALWDRGGRWRIDNIVKAGVYGNDSGRQSTVLDTGTQVLPASDLDGQVAFLGEVGLYGVYRLTRCLSIRGGYQVMWIEGVALATDQVAVTDFVDQNGIDAGGGLFYHGALLGIELTR